MKKVTATEANKRLVRQEIERVWERGDLTFADEYVAEDYVLYDPAHPDPVRGREGFRSHAEMAVTAFPDVEVTDVQMIAEGDTVAARYTWRGTHEGELMGIEPTGIEVTGTGTIFVRIEDGLIREEWTVEDGFGLMEQLGVVEDAGA